MIPFVDTHCHLDLVKNIQNDVSQEDGLGIKSISVTNAPFLFSPNQRLFKNCKNIRVAIGMHPELVSQYRSQINEFSSQLQQTKYVGEIGLDGSREFKDSFAEQKDTLEEILKLCKKASHKILTVHSRNAASDVVNLLDKHLKNSTCKIILHWFSGSRLELKRADELGCYFSVNHKMVSSEKGRSLIAGIPLPSLLTETDSPFTLNYGVENRVQSLQITINTLAKIYGRSADDIKSIVFNNFSGMLKSVQ